MSSHIIVAHVFLELLLRRGILLVSASLQNFHYLHTSSESDTRDDTIIAFPPLRFQAQVPVPGPLNVDLRLGLFASMLSPSGLNVLV